MHAILTGHSRGLGAAICQDLLARGCTVLGLARKENAQLGQRYPQLLTQIKIDLADPEELSAALQGADVRSALAATGTLLLINNAAVLQPVGAPGRQGAAAIARAVNVNVTAPLVLADAVAASCSASRERRILHLSSGAARTAYPGWSIYCATKAALDHHARAVMLDAVPGLKIASLAPGVIDTDMQSEIRSCPIERFPLRARFETLKSEGQLAPAESSARRLVEFLLSENFGGNPVADLREL